MSNKKIKTLKVGILGEPNTGKSTLFNTLMNKKYSIVTRKAQTTIRKNSAVLVKKNKQIIFTDTPGVITYKKNINRGMYKESSNVAFEVDVILLLFNIKKDTIEKIKATANFYDKHEVEVIILLNKIDLLNAETFYKKVSLMKSELENKILFSISGKKNIGVDQLINYLNKNKNFVNEKPFFQKDLSTDVNYLTEIVREKVLENIHDEIPFNLKFTLDKAHINKDKSVTVHITIYMKKLSYKPIIIGKKGENIKKISISARKDLEETLNKKFHLFLYLKTLKNNSIIQNKGKNNDYLG